MTAMPAGDKSFFASFFSKKEDSSFLKKRSKKLSSIWFRHDR